MSAAPRPDTEAARLDALRHYRILDTPAEEGFDDLARLAAQICEVPIGLVSFLDQNRQWFKARVGLDACETPRDVALCAHAILGQDLLIVPDTAHDPRVADSPLVTGPPYVRFYAGMPLRSPEGLAVGTLCVLDTAPRQLTGAQQSALVRLGRLAVGQLELRRKVLEIPDAPGKLNLPSGAVREFIDRLPVAVFECDEHGWCTAANARCTEQSGLTATDAMGMGWLRAVDPEDRERVAREWTEAVRAGRDFATSSRYRRPDGTVRWIEIQAVARRDRKGTMLGFTGVAQDVTARHQLMESSRLRSEFLASRSHEIRTPMIGVLGMTQLLLQSQLTVEQRECADTIRVSAEALATIINDILDVSRIEAGKLALEPVAFDLLKETEEVLELLLPKVHERNLELVLVIAPDVPRQRQGDPVRIRQLLTNLIGNAVKFTEQGHILVEIRLDGGTPERPIVRFQVTDTGIGIAPDRIDSIFERFTQADQSTTRRFGDPGLGLAICRQLVHLMGGTIGVTSEPGRGSTFWFSLPLPPGTDAAPSPLQPVKARVLVVDDLAPAREALQQTLVQLGASVEGAASLDAAVDAVATHRARGAPFDALLLDHSAAGPDLEAGIRHLTTHPAFGGARLILLRATTQRPADGWLAGLGATALVRKPIRLEELRMALTGTPATVPPPAAPATVPGSPTPAPSGLAVLVVDDNSVNQKVAARMLAKLGCTVEVAAHGREALEMVMQTPYAVVFMDCMMPEMDGYEATGAIRRLDGPAARTPIIAMTANAMQGDRERCLAAGMDDYLSKPVQPELLRQALERWGARGRSTEPGTAPPVDPNVLEAFRQLQEEGGPDVVTELIDLFLADLPARREAIIQSLSERDTGRTRAAAHSLKSSATYIGAQELARICRDLEAAARRGDTESCIRSGVTLEQEAERVTRYLHSARPGAAS